MLKYGALKGHGNGGKKREKWEVLLHLLTKLCKTVYSLKNAGLF